MILKIEEGTEEITRVDEIEFDKVDSLSQIQNIDDKFWFGLVLTPCTFVVYKINDQNKLVENSCTTFTSSNVAFHQVSFTVDKSSNLIHCFYSNYLYAFSFDSFENERSIQLISNIGNPSGHPIHKMIIVNLSSYSTSVIFFIDRISNLSSYMFHKETNKYQLFKNNLKLNVASTAKSGLIY